MGDVTGSFTAEETFLDLLSRQMLRADPVGGAIGVRLSFADEMVEQMSLQNHPFHYAAVTGNWALALRLHERGLRPGGTSIDLAQFCAAGPRGTTPWRKTLSVLPSEAAQLAGHGQAALLLQNLEAGLPQEWTRASHNKFPQHFREELQRQVRPLVQSAWFIALPGAVRLQLVDEIARQLCSEMIWPMLTPAFLATPWEERLAPPLLSACDAVSEPGQGPSSGGRRGRQQGRLPLYAFRIAGRNVPTGPWRPFLRLAGAVLSGTLWRHALCSHGQRQELLVFAAAMNAAGMYTTSAVMLLVHLLKRGG